MNNKSKVDIDNIIIPDSLNSVVEASLKKGRRERIKSRIKGVALSVLILFSGFTLAVNTIDSVASAGYKIPWLRELTRIVDFDRGYKSSVDKNLVEEIGYVETKNGVTIRVNTIVGDYKGLWVGYEVISDLKIDERIEVNNVLGKGNLSALSSGSHLEDYSKSRRYSVIGFDNPVEGFNITFKLINKDTGVEVAGFNVPIKLNKNMMASTLKKLDINQVKANTNAGELILYDFESTVTRTRMKIKFNSDKYNYSGFENPRLIVDGKVHRIPSFYPLSNSSEYSIIEFQGSINGARSIEFICDGVYYMYRNGNEIEIDLNKGTIEPNKYNISILDMNNNKPREIKLIAPNVGNISASFVNTLKGKTIGEDDYLSQGRDFIKGSNLELIFKVDKSSDKGILRIHNAYIGLTDKINLNIK
ncbi:MAG: DUF4179 domain-containing protein [Clostridium sp.]